MYKNNIDKQYLELLNDILENGIKKGDRTGTGTISVFGRQLKHSMSLGFPAITTKKLAFKTMVKELLWFLRGETNIRPLVSSGCNIWNSDCYKAYQKKASKYEEPDYNIHVDDPMQNCTRLMTQDEFIEKIKKDKDFASQWGDLGPIYGKQWRSWKIADGAYTRYVDQIKEIIRQLKQNPDSRRIIVSAHNVGEIKQMTLPPCHNFFQFNTIKLSQDDRFNWWFANKKPHRDIVEYYDDISNEDKINFLDKRSIPKRKISLMFNMRSVDVPLGLPFNIASYATLLELIALEVNMIPNELIANLGDTHIYQNQIDGVKEQIKRNVYKLPKLIINNEFCNYDVSLLNQIKYIQPDDFFLDGYNHHSSIKFPLSN